MMENPFDVIYSELRELRAKVDVIDQKLTEQGKDQLLTTTEATELLKVSRATLWNWRKSGQLRPQQVGGVIRYRKRDVLTLKGGSDGGNNPK